MLLRLSSQLPVERGIVGSCAPYDFSFWLAWWGPPCRDDHTGRVIPLEYRGWHVGLSADSARRLAREGFALDLVCPGPPDSMLACYGSPLTGGGAVLMVYLSVDTQRVVNVSITRPLPTALSVDSLRASFIEAWGPAKPDTLSIADSTGVLGATAVSLGTWERKGDYAVAAIVRVRGEPHLHVMLWSGPRNHRLGQRPCWPRSHEAVAL